MKILKFKKAFIFCILCLFLISLFAVNCFAFSTENSVFIPSGTTITFNDDIILPDSNIFEEFYFETYYDNALTLFSYFGLYSFSTPNGMFYENDQLSTFVYYIDNGWVDPSLRTITFRFDTYISPEFYDFLLENSDLTLPSKNTFYQDLYEIIISNVYGGVDLTPDMTLSASLISSVLSILVILTPILVCGFIFIFILKRV